MGTRKSTDYTSFCETLEWWLNEAEGEATKDRVFFSKEKSRILVQKALEESREQGIDDLKLFTAIRTSYLIGCNMDSWMADYTKDASGKGCVYPPSIFGRKGKIPWKYWFDSGEMPQWKEQK